MRAQLAEMSMIFTHISGTFVGGGGGGSEKAGLSWDADCWTFLLLGTVSGLSLSYDLSTGPRH